MNTGLIAGATAVSTGQSIVFVWKQHFVATWPGFLLGALFAAGGTAGAPRTAPGPLLDWPPPRRPSCGSDSRSCS